MKIAFEQAIDALTDAAQFIDAVKPDAVREGWWSEWDQEMREKITKALRSCYAGKAEAITIGDPAEPRAD